MKSNKSKPLRVGVIGLGVGEQHLIAFLKDPRCTIIRVCDRDLVKLHQITTKYGVIGTHEPNDILLASDIDLVSIATYDNDHADQILKSIRYNKHIFIEKPLCQSTEELIQIHKELKKSQKEVKISCNLVLRAAPLYQWLKKNIQRGLFGEIFSIDGEYFYGRIEKITEGWRNSVPNYSVMEGGGIHLIDLLLWMTNSRPTRVFSIGNNICTIGTQFKYNDYVTSTLQTSSGMIWRLTANFGCVHRHHHILRIFGTRATFLYDDMGPRVHWTRDPAVHASPININPLPGSKGDLIPHFIDIIVNDEDISDEIKTFIDGISICIACDRSMLSGIGELIEYL